LFRVSAIEPDDDLGEIIDLCNFIDNLRQGRLLDLGIKTWQHQCHRPGLGDRLKVRLQILELTVVEVV
jgi:hypothetical protein